MKDRALVATGAAGAVLGICCAVMHGASGLAAWLAKALYALIPVLILGAGLIKAATEAAYAAAIT